MISGGPVLDQAADAKQAAIVPDYGGGCAALGVPTGAVHVIGASGRSGVPLCRALAADGVAVVPVVRDSAKWRAGGIGVAPLVADLTDAPALRSALHSATRVVSCAHARFAPAVLAAGPPGARYV